MCEVRTFSDRELDVYILSVVGAIKSRRDGLST
jgi:hypothetical protein